MKKHTLLRFLGTILFSIGTLLSLFLLVITVWGDLEATFFASTLEAEKSLHSLRCPILISSNEVGQIKATLKNPLEKDWERYVRVNISDKYITLRREIKGNVQIPAGGGETVTWEIYPENAVYNRFIFVNIYVNAKYPYPSLGGSCGVFLLDLWNLTGNQSLILIIISSLLTLTIGVILWKMSTKPREGRIWYTYRSMIGLAVIVYIGLVIGYFGAWIFALLFLVIALLLSGIIIGRKISSN